MICEQWSEADRPPKHDVTSPTLPQSPIIQEPPDPITHHFAETRHAAAGGSPWHQIPDSCTRAQKTSTNKSSMSTDNPTVPPHRIPPPALGHERVTRVCTQRRLQGQENMMRKQRGDHALAMNKNLGVSGGRCRVTLIHHEATASHDMGPATMGSRHRTLQLVDGDV